MLIAIGLIYLTNAIFVFASMWFNMVFNEPLTTKEILWRLAVPIKWML